MKFDNNKIPIIAIVGPTAVGKTNLSIKLAKYFNCEIISVDSVQIYKFFDIGSAKITVDEMCEVKHHLIDILEPTDKFSVYDFQKLARKKIEEVHKKGKIPLLIGGTGYYMNAVLYNYEFSNLDNEYKKNLSLLEMKEYLKKNDKETYEKIDLSNERRIINAYNYVQNEQKSFVKNNQGNKLFENYQPYILVLEKNRDELYERINKRVDKMINLGLEKEVRDIMLNYGKKLQPLSSIGYKEIIEYLDKNISLDFAIESIKKNSRRYAKRQITWFKNKMFDTHVYNVDKLNIDDLKEDIKKYFKENNYENN